MRQCGEKIYSLSVSQKKYGLAFLALFLGINQKIWPLFPSQFRANKWPEIKNILWPFELPPKVSPT